MDNFVAQILSSLSRMKSIFNHQDINRVMNYDPDLLIVHFDARNPKLENQVLLGSKGFFLKRLHQYEYPVPPGFIITTELFRNKGIITAHPDIELEWHELLRENIARLERKTGQCYGDMDEPLLLSVRSGAQCRSPVP